MLARIVSVIGLVLLLSGCATMFNPGPTNFTATSTPSGATVEVVAVRTGEAFTRVTPATFTLNKGSDYRLTFELAGYRSEEIMVRREVNAWLFGSILLGILPAVVDFATDSMWDHTITVADVQFVRTTSQHDAPGAIVTVGLTDELGNTTWARVPIALHRI